MKYFQKDSKNEMRIKTILFENLKDGKLNWNQKHALLVRCIKALPNYDKLKRFFIADLMSNGLPAEKAKASAAELINNLKIIDKIAIEAEPKNEIIHYPIIEDICTILLFEQEKYKKDFDEYLKTYDEVCSRMKTFHKLVTYHYNLINLSLNKNRDVQKKVGVLTLRDKKMREFDEWWNKFPDMLKQIDFYDRLRKDIRNIYPGVKKLSKESARIIINLVDRFGKNDINKILTPLAIILAEYRYKPLVTDDKSMDRLPDREIKKNKNWAKRVIKDQLRNIIKRKDGYLKHFEYDIEESNRTI